MADKKDVEYYMFDLARLPNEEFKSSVPMETWHKHLKTVGKEGFPAGSLGEVVPIGLWTLVERSVGFPLYMIGNAAPFMLPVILYLSVGVKGSAYFVCSLLALHLVFTITNPMNNPKDGQYLYTERNIQKYNSIKWVWPKSLQPPKLAGKKLFCTIPHGLAPVGVTSYPMWSKVFGETFCHWTCAPIVLKLPIISYYLKMVGYVKAKSECIKEVLAKNESAGVILDGINGMFQLDDKCERAFLKQRKGIVKIALTTGTPIVPCYCFGTSQLWRIIVDPFGILEKLSISLETSVTPFCGRPFGLLPFGPPRRTPILVAFGEPIVVPKVDQPTQELIDEWHAKLIQSFQDVFDQHKAAYGWPDKTLKVV